MKSQTQHQFSTVPSAEIQRSSFDRSSGLKTTFDGGNLVPVFIDEVLPGDTFSLQMAAFVRLATPIKPIMDNLHLESFFFYVPARLCWNSWTKMNGEQNDPDDPVDYLVPIVTASTIAINSIGDYFGLPTGIAGVAPIALPFRAYNLIYNEWFRDENLIDSAAKNVGIGPDVMTDYTIRKRGKRKDYFTSCLPWPQKGPAVGISIGTSAIVKTQATEFVPNATQTAMIMRERTAPNAPPGAGNELMHTQGGTGLVWGSVTLAGTPTDGLYPSNLYADLTTATSATINSLREAFQLQRLYERDARGGTRYTEVIRSHFGVVSPDQRVQRPEYLGGGHSNINISPIAQTSAATAQPTPQGNLSAIGTASISRHGFSKSFTEHGYIIGLVNVRADLTYQQGLAKMWSRRTRFDFYWPALAHLGEQAVLNKEIYFQNLAADELVFGYQERYAEYRFKPSRITSIFRSTAAGTLDVWHLAQKFTTLPVLNQTFIEESPPIDRIVAVPSEPDFLADFHFSLRCARPMPVYSVPGLIDHF